MQYRKIILFALISPCLVLTANALAGLSQTYQFFTHSLTPKNVRVLKQTGELAGGLGEGWSSDNDVPVGQCLLGAIGMCQRK